MHSEPRRGDIRSNGCLTSPLRGSNGYLPTFPRLARRGLQDVADTRLWIARTLKLALMGRWPGLRYFAPLGLRISAGFSASSKHLDVLLPHRSSDLTCPCSPGRLCQK